METTFAQGYALLIGVDEHSVPRYALPAVGQDLAALAAVLNHPDRCAYPSDHVRVLQGKQATRAAILDGLDWLQQQLAADRIGNVNTRGDFVGRSVHTHYHTAFDQRGQTVGGNQTNIAGDVNTGGGALNSGSMGNTQIDLAAQLRQLRTAIIQAGAQGLLDGESMIDANGALQKALYQAEQPTPDRQAIRHHLLTAQGIAQNTGGAGALAGQIAGVVGLLG